MDNYDLIKKYDKIISLKKTNILITTKINLIIIQWIQDIATDDEIYELLSYSDDINILFS